MVSGILVPSRAAARAERGDAFARLRAMPIGFLLIAWMAVCILLAIDLTWAAMAGLKFTGWPDVFCTVAILAAIPLSYSDSENRARLADLGHYAALWIAFSAAGAMFTYVVATMRMPLCDAYLARFDAALGFHWTPVYRFIVHRAWLRWPMGLVYMTMLPQIIGSIMFFAHTQRTDRNREFVAIAMVSLIICTIVAGFAPALGPFVPGHQPEFSKTLMAIRSGAATIFPLDQMQGIVEMPSYHTVTAILLIYVHRPPARSFRLVAVLNVLMLLSVPTAGNHYLTDVVTGSAVALASIAMVKLFALDRSDVFLFNPAKGEEAIL
jgi:PAP2 superfamily